MADTAWIKSIHIVLLLTSAASLPEANVSSSSGACEKALEEMTQKFQLYQTQTLEAFQDISDEEQLCSPPPVTSEMELKEERALTAGLQPQLELEGVEKVGLENELNQANTAKAGLETQLRQERDAKVELETQLRHEQDAKASLETELRKERDAKVGLETQLHQQQDAKASLETELRKERDAKVGLETQLRQHQDYKAAMETELRQERDATHVLGTRLHQERDAKTELELQLRQERAKARMAKDLITVVATALATEKHQATVPRKEVYGKLNGSVELSCLSESQPLSLCVWERNVQGQGEIIIVDQQVIQNGGATSVDGIYATVDGFGNETCALRIQRLKKDDFGNWSCTLVTKSGRAYGGIVTVDENDPPSIYFGTRKGVKRYSLGTDVVETVADSREAVYGVAFDWLRDKVYYSSLDKVFRANRDGTEVETVLHTTKYGGLQGLALDWVTGNIYIASYGGVILACDGRPTASFACTTVLTGHTYLNDIALDPVSGTMYWTTSSFKFSSSSIMRSNLDGTNPVTLVTDLAAPFGIAIDFSSQRLYWTESYDNTIQSSDLRGQGVQTVFQVSDGLDRYPWGVGVVGDRIYWGTQGSYTLQSGSKSGGQIVTHYNGTNYLSNLAVVPSPDLPRNRTNHCEGHNCRKVCVLTATSSRCLE